LEYPLENIISKKSKNKSWEGVIAEFIVNLIIGFILLNNIILVLTMALVATLVETFFTQIDDNISIPVISGFVGQILVIFI
jgi:phytol kinase